MKSLTRLVRPGAEEHDVAGLRAASRRARAVSAASSRNFAIGELMPSRPFARSSTFIQARPFAPYLRGVCAEVVDLLARQLAPPGTRSAATRPSGSFAGSANTLNSTCLTEFGDVDELERDAQVGLVRAVAAHRFCVRHARERLGELDVDALP